MRQTRFSTRPPADKSAGYEATPRKRGLKGGFTRQPRHLCRGEDGRKLWEMLQQSKTTFPVLSGPQTGPRWLAGLAAEGTQPLANIEQLTLDVSAAMWDALHALGRNGCRQRTTPTTVCPAAEACPVAQWCQWGNSINE